MRSNKPFTIGVLAKRARVSPHTIVYYERQGLLPPARRSMRGYRLFSVECVRRIRFIGQTQHFGVLAQGNQGAARAAGQPTGTCVNVGERIGAKLRDVDEKLRTPRQTRRTLAQLVVQCRGQGSLSACPRLHQLGTQAVAERIPPLRQEMPPQPPTAPDRRHSRMRRSHPS